MFKNFCRASFKSRLLLQTPFLFPNPHHNKKDAMKKKYKTKFPVARIKKIMQMDEDVGKVAQATPVLISKALELFMQSLIDQACQEARQRNAKRLTPAHLKKTIETVEQFDFLKDMVANIRDPVDAPAEDESKPARSSRRKSSKAASAANSAVAKQEEAEEEEEA
ncbi:hypothetical protein VTP01DRAFT_9781 [Rhizomucor pusillus]|uniref:uncharacterized protein n=1 Tax=Rhizomucor pusillus TaxID=4840 RepID=UPI0037445FEA